MVEDTDPVGQSIRLLEVLRGQQDGDAARDEIPDRLPHDPPAAGIESRGRLVEEDDPRVADERHREVETSSHASGVGRDRFLRGVDQVEPLEQLRYSPPALGLAEMPQIRDELQVLLAAEEPVDGRELTGDADHGADRVGLAGDIVAGDLDLAAVRGDEGRQDMDRRRLAGAVRSEKGVDRPLGDLEVDTVEDDLRAVRLAQPGGADRGPGPGGRHAAPSRATAPPGRRSDVEVLDGWPLGLAGDHVVELRRDSLAELFERLDDLEGRLAG